MSVHIVTARDPTVLRHLAWGPLARTGVTYEAVSSGLEALEAISRLRPRVAILTAGMPPLGGLEVCRELGRREDLAATRSLLVHPGCATRSLLDEVAGVGCDDLVVEPIGVAEFTTHVQDLLGLPRRRFRRVTVELVAWVETSARVFVGHAENLSVAGAKVQLDEPLAAIGTVRVHLTRAQDDAGVVVDARVVWLRDHGREVGLEFDSLSPEQSRQVESLVLWDLVEEDGLSRVYLEGDLVETTDLAPLAARLDPLVDFDVAGIHHVNSHGGRRWAAFLERLDDEQRYTFSRCSSAFMHQACFLPTFLGRGRIVSLMAPYQCEGCEREETRVLETAALVREGGAFLIPRFRCRECGGMRTFDEVPERYLACLGP